MQETSRARRVRIALGLAGLLFYVAHAGASARIGRPALGLWICHLGAMAIGIGLLGRRSLAIAIGFFWLATGTPLWIRDVLWGVGEFYPTSALTHAGGLALAVYGIARLGFPRGAWWRAIAGLIVMWGIARLVTPPRENVNFAHAIWSGWEATFRGSYPLFLGVVVGVAAVYFVGLEWAIRRIALRIRA